MNDFSDVLSAVFARRDTDGRLLRPAHSRAVSSTTPILYRARLIPLFVNAIEHEVLEPPVHYEVLRGLAAGIACFQARLRQELLDVLTELRASGVRAIPIKGAHSLLWGQGPSVELHTRDLDVLIEPDDYAAVTAELTARGYRQLAAMDPATGRTMDASSTLRDRSERDGYYAYFPWSRIVPFPSIHPYFNHFLGLERIGIPIFPLLRVEGEPCLMLSFDVHHSLWPSLQTASLELETSLAAGQPIGHLSRVDRIVAHGIHTIGKLVDPNLGPEGWGQLSQLTYAMADAEPATLLARCDERAAQLGLAVQWLHASELMAALAQQVDLQDTRFRGELRRPAPAIFKSFLQRYKSSDS